MPNCGRAKSCAESKGDQYARMYQACQYNHHMQTYSERWYIEWRRSICTIILYPIALWIQGGDKNSSPTSSKYMSKCSLTMWLARSKQLQMSSVKPYTRRIRHRAFRHRWSVLMLKSSPLGVMLSCLPFQNRKHSRTPAYHFSTHFFDVGKSSPQALKREP